MDDFVSSKGSGKFFSKDLLVVEALYRRLYDYTVEVQLPLHQSQRKV
jgi:hypothetical protein